jgi:hypothetical protein
MQAVGLGFAAAVDQHYAMAVAAQALTTIGSPWQSRAGNEKGRLLRGLQLDVKRPPETASPSRGLAQANPITTTNRNISGGG